MSHVFQHTYKGSKLTRMIKGIVNNIEFQHTYKGSKLFYSCITHMHHLCSSIPTRVRNDKREVQPVPIASTFQHTYKGSKRLSGCSQECTISWFQHTYKGSKLSARKQKEGEDEKFQHTYKGSKLLKTVY